METKADHKMNYDAEMKSSEYYEDVFEEEEKGHGVLDVGFRGRSL